MFTISLCMIVKDEADCLERILSCAKTFADEIIVVDTGSQDDTKQIAKKFTDKVYDFEWCDDFAKARNFAFSFAKCDFQMWLDADDFIDEDNIKKILQLKKNFSVSALEHNKSSEKSKEQNIKNRTTRKGKLQKDLTCPPAIEAPDVFMCKYAIGFDETNHPSLIYDRERILKRSKNFVWEGFVHEAIVPQGKIQFTDIEIQHRKIHTTDPKRNLKLYENAIKKGAVLNAREMYYFSRELFYNQNFKKSAHYLQKFIKLPNPFQPDFLGAHLMLSDCFRNQGQFDKALDVLLTYLKTSQPTAEICCKIAYLFDDLKNPENAIFWFTAATTCQKQTFGFVNEDCENVIPFLELSRLFFNKDYALAKSFHEKVKQIRPNHKAVLFNEKFFKN